MSNESKLFDGVIIVGLREVEDEESSLFSLIPEIEYSFPPLPEVDYDEIRRTKDHGAKDTPTKNEGAEQVKELEKQKEHSEEKTTDKEKENGEGKGVNDERTEEFGTKIIEANGGSNGADKTAVKGDDTVPESDKPKGVDSDKTAGTTAGDDEPLPDEPLSARNRRQSVMLMEVERGSLAKDLTLLDQIREFCFPDISSFITFRTPKKKVSKGSLIEPESKKPSKIRRWKVKKKNLEERFSFVLTSATGERRWGYCARMVPTPPSGAPTLPLCFCILSFIPCFRIYSKILDTLVEFQKYRPGNLPPPQLIPAKPAKIYLISL